MNIYILDPGQTRYGDCILITRSNRAILVDGAHSKDAESIKSQLVGIFKKQPPFNIDLLVVSHAHSDHIGCLPKLVQEGSLSFETALVADEKLGFGRDATDRGPADSLQSSAKKALVAVMMEEDHSSMTGTALQDFLSDAVNLEDSYIKMLSTLEENGTKVLRYLGLQETKGITTLEKEFSDFGLKILGPTQEHLLLCTDVLTKQADKQAASIDENFSDNLSMADLASAYKQTVVQFFPGSDDENAQDRVGPGAAKNDQSIVFKVEADGWSALLAADMQFAKAEVAGLDNVMSQLLANVNSEGPYDLIKLTHHSSYNGLNEDILKEWHKHTKNFAHTGGINDKDHPDPGTLDILKNLEGSLKFARTDRNGLITIKKSGNSITMIPTKGTLDNFSVNKAGDEQMSVLGKPVTPATQKTATTTERNVITEQKEIYDGQMVEVITRVPHKSTRVTITIDIDPEKKNADIVKPKLPPTDWTSPSKERLEGLAFVTSSPLLSRNIGKSEASQIISNLSKNNLLIDLPVDIIDAKQAADIVRQKLNKQIKGIVIVGGYDVVPSMQMDVIDQTLREKIRQQNKNNLDSDNFIVWTDDIYGDTDGDIIPEIPVSRIPDARRSDLVINALNCTPYSAQTNTLNKFGIRNMARPFADDVFAGLEISEAFGPTNIRQGSTTGSVYFMLHGSFSDSTRFWGERQNGDSFEAVNIKNIPDSTPSTIIFTGCCWGGLSVYPPACLKTPTIEIRPKAPEESIALKFLLSGAQAFIGCTGSHYSPLAPPFNYYGKPMHDGFWKAIATGKAPAEALFKAKQEFGANIPHNLQDPYSQAVEAKILWQYTCLGLGW